MVPIALPLMKVFILSTNCPDISASRGGNRRPDLFQLTPPNVICKAVPGSTDAPDKTSGEKTRHLVHRNQC